MKLDCIGTIEACYAPIAEDAAWLGNIVSTLRPLVGELPATAFTFSLERGRFEIGAVGVEDAAIRAQYRAMLAPWEAADPAFVRRWYAPVPPVELASRRIAKMPRHLLPHLQPFFQSAGVVDALGVLALEPDNRGLTLTVPYAVPPRLAPRTISQLRRVTAHLGTALRLRSRTRAPPGPDEAGVEAVLDPDGRVRHATGAARDGAVRESLARAVHNVERARGRLRRSSQDEALSLWEGLVSGRWSLIDHVEADGRRLVLMRRNEPGVRDPKALAPGERHVLAFAALGHSNKHIGYALGLAPTTVASHLAAAMAKLGVRSRREAIAMFGGEAEDAS